MEGMIQYRNKRNRATPWLNQYYATSGNVPSENALNEIIQAELAQAYQDRMRQQALAFQRERFEAQKKAWKDAREDRQEQMLWGGLGQLGTAAIGALGKEGLGKIWDWGSEKVGQGADYVKGALGFGTPVDHAAITEQRLNDFYNNPTEGISNTANWNELVRSNPTQFNDASAFNSNTPVTTSTPVGRRVATPVSNRGAIPTRQSVTPPVSMGEIATPPVRSAIQFNPAPKPKDISWYDYETLQAEKSGMLPSLQTWVSGLNANPREGLMTEARNQAINATKGYQGIELSKKYNALFNQYLSRGMSEPSARYLAKRDLGLE